MCFANKLYSMLFILSVYFLFTQRIPQTSSGIMHHDPWILVESDSSDDEEVVGASTSKDVERQCELLTRLFRVCMLTVLCCHSAVYNDDLLDRIETFRRQSIIFC